MSDRPLSVLSVAALATAMGACGSGGDQRSPAPSIATLTVNQFERNDTVYPGYRRNHAKGVCISGHFRSSGAAAPYSTARVFAPGVVTPVLGRFSIPGTSPHAWDDSTPIRGMALQFTQADGAQWRTAMNAVPAFPVATPKANYRFLQAQHPDPATGNPDPHKLATFFASHPRADAFRAWDRSTAPSGSYATLRYNSLNTFFLVDAQGRRQAVRWSMLPEAVARDAAPTFDRPDVLDADLRRRLARGPLRWQLEIVFAALGDAIDNASIAWPAERRHVRAGTLVITASQPQPNGACRDINFNPLVLPRGMVPSDDPLLQLRAQAYAVSHRRRVHEQQVQAGRAKRAAGAARPTHHE